MTWYGLDEYAFRCYDCRLLTWVCGCFAHWHCESGDLIYAKPCRHHGSKDE